MTDSTVTTGCQYRVVMHFQTAVENRLAGVAGRTGHVGHINGRVAIGTSTRSPCFRRMMHRPLAIENRLVRMAGRAIQLGLVNSMTQDAIVCLARCCRMVTATEEIRVAAGVTIVTLVRSHQRVEI